MTDPGDRTLTLPQHPPPLARTPFPLLATIAPVLVSVVLWQVTGSIFMLAFAVLGPVVGLASLADGGRQRRRSARTGRARFGDALAFADRRLADLHREECERLDRAAPDPAGAVVPRWSDEVRELHLGWAAVASGVRVSPDPVFDEPPELGDLRARAAVLEDAPFRIPLPEQLVVVGPPELTAPVVRAIVIRLAADIPPEHGVLEVSATELEPWLEALPHRVDPVPHSGGDAMRVTVRHPGGTVEVIAATRPRPDAAALLLDTDVPLFVERVGRRPEAHGVAGAAGAAGAAGVALVPVLLGREAAREAAITLAGTAARAGRIPASARLPSELLLADLPPALQHGLTAVVGVDTEGVVELDLVRDGPHAVIGGTTGSGKSELLTTWVTALAQTHPPERLTLLLVDFKGGATFGRFERLPHTVGLLTDLDEGGSERALRSLRAELRTRERLLVEAGVRSIDDAPALATGALDARGGPGAGSAGPLSLPPRLVIVVDEYAALLEQHPDLGAVFQDIAARGRSLGVHLVLCTQRPAGVVREAVLANAGLRISLRVLTEADSRAVLGVPDAAALQTRGRALIHGADGRIRTAQFALTDDACIGRAAGWPPAPLRRPWVPPLPARVTLEQARETLRAFRGGRAHDPRDVLLGLLDAPDEQRHRPALWRPRASGPLLIAGASGSGKTGALRALAAGADADVIVAGAGGGGLWDAIASAEERMRAADPARRPAGPSIARAAPDRELLLLVDDLDVTLSGIDDELARELTQRLMRLLREGSSRGVHVALTLGRVAGGMQQLAALCGSTLVLRMPSAHEHLLAGGRPGSFVAGLVPGAGLLDGERVQLALAPALPEPAPLARTRLRLAERPTLLAVAARPAVLHRLIATVAPDEAVEVVTVGGGDPRRLQTSTAVRSRVLLGGPEDWQAWYGALGELARDAPLLIHGCSAAELRPLLRRPPVLPPGDGEPLWLLEPDGSAQRVELLP